MTNGLDLLAQTIVTGNLLLIQGLGLYALTRHTKTVNDAIKSGLNTLVAMVVGGVLLWLLGGFVPSGMAVEVGFFLVIGLLAAVSAPIILGQKTCAQQNLVDSALVGLLLLLARDGISGVQSVWMALGAGVGYLLALVVMATLRDRLELAPIPKALRGTPILLITAGLLAIALLGFRF